MLFGRFFEEELLEIEEFVQSTAFTWGLRILILAICLKINVNMTSNSSRIRHSSIISRAPFFYGWVILTVSALTRFISGPGQTFLISVFIDPVISDLGWSRTLVSSLYTAGSLTAGVAVIFVGRLLDRYGARIMLLVIGILFGLAALWMSTVNHPVKLYFGFAALRTLG